MPITVRLIWNAWVNIFKEFSESFGMKVDMNDLYGNPLPEGTGREIRTGGGLLSYMIFSREFIMGMEEGRPLFVRKPDSKFNSPTL